MITKLSHATVYVTDQDEALAFYTEKLGFEVRMDANMEGFRWLTVGPKDQPDLEIVLIKPGAPMFDDEAAGKLAAIQKKGMMGCGVFETSDCEKAYEEMKGKGVEFLSPPQKRPYGTEAVFRDNSGNWFSLTQH